MIQAESNDIGSLEALTGRLVPSPDQQRPHNHIDQLKAVAASAQSNLPMPTPRCKVEAGLGTGTSAGTLNGIGHSSIKELLLPGRGSVGEAQQCPVGK